MLSLRKAAVAAAAAVGIAAFLPAASAGAATSTNLVNGYSGLCLAVAHPDYQTQGAPVFQYPCTGNSDQVWNWTLKPGTEATYQLRNAQTQMCLAIPSGSSTPGVGAIQWPCSDSGSQLFILDSIARLHPWESQNLCLAIPKSQTAPGIQAIQWTCNTNYDQEWLF